MAGNSFTLLVIAPWGMPPYAIRGLTQTLELIAATAASARRTINGVLHDLSMPQFRKYRSTITCTDQSVPALDGVWPGAQVTVDCVSELAHPVGQLPERVVVPGSLRAEDGYEFYRPRLTMMVMAYGVTTNEYELDIGWQLDLEEL